MTQTDQQNVPKLRFPGFEEAWKTRKIGELGTVSMCKRIMKDETKPSGDVPFYKIGTFGREPDAFIDQATFERYRERYSFPNTGDILISAAGTIGRLVVYDGAPAYFQDSNIVWVANDEQKVRNDFLLSCYQNVRWTTEDTTIARLYNDNLRNIDIAAPTLPEQRKIASFLGAVDTKIAQLSRKKALLEDYKKGCMQQLFSQKIRFKDDEGKDFPDWEEKRLGEVFKERKTFMSKGQDLPHVSLTVKGVVDKSERYERDFLVRQEDKQYKITYENDICYNPANLKFGVICRNSFGSGIFSPIYCTLEVSKAHDPRFIEALVTSPDFIKRIRRYEEGTVYERMAVKPADFLLGSEKFPHPDEQRKIADFLSAIDRKIELVGQELEHAKTFKKGLLQQMFV